MSVSVISEYDDVLDRNVAETGGVDDALAMPAAAPALAERVADARADVPISETSERFMRALLTKVPIERIEELYLFAPLRQGAVETGIAVIAARNEVVPAAPVEEDGALTVTLDEAKVAPPTVASSADEAAQTQASNV